VQLTTRSKRNTSRNIEWNVILKKSTLLQPPVIILLVAVPLLIWISDLNSLLFHSIVEAFSLVVTCAIFMFTWNTREYLQNNYLYLIGIAYLFISIFDLLHLLAYPGMGVFPQGGTNLSTQLWIVGRFLSAASYCLAPFFFWRKHLTSLVILIYSTASLIFLLSIFYFQNFPTCYITGSGLTPFKRGSEYLVAGLLLVAIYLLWKVRLEFAPQVVTLLIAALGLKLVSELLFSSYFSIYSHTVLVAHLLRLVSFYMIYLAVIETGLVKPYNILLRKLKQHEQILLQRTKDLSQRNEELDAFSHTVAHDLKNPMSTILIAASAIDDPNLDASEMRSFLHGIVETIHKMSRILDELMLLSQIRKVDIPGELIDMDKIVASARVQLVDALKSSGASLTTPPSWPAALGYAPWIEQVWVNYLSNAVKYGGSPPQIELGVDPLPGGMLRFWVQDNGVGIRAEERQNLFRPFTQLSQAHAKGSGLGLSIVRRIVEKLGGKVGVESQPGLGSRFFFTLPDASRIGEADDSGRPESGLVGVLDAEA
jgi:signal transduction histidine kinase